MQSPEPNNRAVIRLRTAVFDAVTEKAGLRTDTEKAEAIGVSRKLVNQVRNHRADPSGNFMAGAVHALNVRLDDLFEIVAPKVTT